MQRCQNFLPVIFLFIATQQQLKQNYLMKSLKPSYTLGQGSAKIHGKIFLQFATQKSKTMTFNNWIKFYSILFLRDYVFYYMQINGTY